MSIPDINFGVDCGGNVLLQQGDDYLAAAGRALVWTEDSTSDWPDLEGATAVVQITMIPPAKSPTGQVGPLLFMPTIIAGGSTVQAISLDLYGAQTARLAPLPTLYRVIIKATLPGGRGQQRLVDAKLGLVEDPSLVPQIPWFT